MNQENESHPSILATRPGRIIGALVGAAIWTFLVVGFVKDTFEVAGGIGLLPGLAIFRHCSSDS